MLSAESVFVMGLGASAAELDPPTARNPDTMRPRMWPWCRLQPTHIQDGEAPPIIYPDWTLPAPCLHSQQIQFLTLTSKRPWALH